MKNKNLRQVKGNMSQQLQAESQAELPPALRFAPSRGRFAGDAAQDALPLS